MASRDPPPRCISARRWLARGAVALVVGWLATSGAAAYLLTHRLSDPYGEEPVPPDLAGRVEPLVLQSPDGLRIGAWHLEGTLGGAAVLLVHGNGASRARMDGELRELHRAGHHVLAITVRAHGDSGGSLNDIGWGARRDVLAGVAELSRRHPGAPVVVYGNSLGAAAALFAAGEAGDAVDGYILVSPYGDLRDAVRRRTERYLPAVLDELAYAGLLVWAPLLLPDLDRIRPAVAARDVPAGTPVLALVGALDDRAPPADSEAVLAAAGGGELVLFPGLSHQSLLRGDPERWRRHVLGFLRRLGRERARGDCYHRPWTVRGEPMTRPTQC